MGGGGSYYDRDTTDGYTKTSRGYSKAAEELMSQSGVDKGLLPKDRKIVSQAVSPIVYAFDVTGSVDNLPMIITDKMPLIAGQIAQNGYLEDPEICMGAVGDPECDKAPIQIGDFAKLRESDAWLKRIWRENGGGGNNVEGYEYMAYFLARCCEMPKAVTPFCLFTADEGIRPTLDGGTLRTLFGGQHESISSAKVFKELDKKFKDNVFLIHRYYRTGDAEALSTFQKVMPDERIIRLGSDESIGDLTLGLIAVMSGSRTLDQYLKDMKTTRDKAQTDARVEEVRTALAQVAKLAPPPRAWASDKPAAKGKKGSGAKDAGKKKPSSGKKPGRL